MNRGPSASEDRAIADSVRAELRRLGIEYRGAGLADVILEHRAQAAAALLTAQRAAGEREAGVLDVYGPDDDDDGPRCIRGHPFGPNRENRGTAGCKICQADAVRRSRAKKKRRAA